MKVIGLDLSLRRTGVASKVGTSVITTRLTGYSRLRYLVGAITDVCQGADLVVVEGPSYHSQGSSVHQIAGLWWMATASIDEIAPLAIAPPSSIKKYATGKGSAPKDAVLLSTARHFAWFEGDNNEADALWACALGHAKYGNPLTKVPTLNQQALAGVEWPVSIPA